MEEERISDNKTRSRKYQLDRAKEYVEYNTPKDGAEPKLEVCIISDLLNIMREIRGNRYDM